eukprot:4776800-Pleurochrysis_carterae.AAC.1
MEWKGGRAHREEVLGELRARRMSFDARSSALCFEGVSAAGKGNSDHGSGAARVPTRRRLRAAMSRGACCLSFCYLEPPSLPACLRDLPLLYLSLPALPPHNCKRCVALADLIVMLSLLLDDAPRRASRLSVLFFDVYGPSPMRSLFAGDAARSNLFGKGGESVGRGGAEGIGGSSQDIF